MPPLQQCFDVPTDQQNAACNWPQYPTKYLLFSQLSQLIYSRRRTLRQLTALRILQCFDFQQISGQRLVAIVDSWDVGHVFPSGHYVAALGPVGEVGPMGWL